MIEFSEDLSKRYEGVPAVSQRAMYRLKVRKGEIPYFNGGIDVNEFTYGNDLTATVRNVLSDFHAYINVEGDRVLIGDIDIEIPRGLI